MKRRIPKVCERCGQDFVCGLFGCWCSEIPVSEQKYASIVERYHECLCPSCLPEVVAQLEEPPSLEPSPHFSTGT